MPIYMDRHDVSNTVTAENVAQLHHQDLKIQHKFECRGLTYWFDEKRKIAFCLVEAPNEEAIVEMHRQAHGEVPNQIIEVDIAVVESFLGRIEDPESEHREALKIIDEPAFRIIMITGFDDCAFNTGKNKPPNLAQYLKSMGNVFGNFDGRIVKQQQYNFLISFKSVSKAIRCAIEIQKHFSERCKANDCSQLSLKTGICPGIPFSGKESFFKDSVQMAKRLYCISDSKMVVSHEVKMLYSDENPDVPLDRELFLLLDPSDEKFINSLMTYMEENWQNPNLQLSDIESFLGSSKSQVYRKLKSLTGTSPNNFIKNYRLQNAFELIKNQIGNISEVAFQVGFNSPSYFAKCFHKRYGILPSDLLQVIE
ncbi:DUF4242 domain-containing protein [Christiangramia fulva]|uniref:DUF4242 domain-containing protein n=1 Tax=Christiangramia fulva TaxID=2126553 RepID=A0A2R3Z4G4_9FLAO|nr:nickel-binding protein [Christiangramia fulva]AVR45155.1 DUF4242 domain-containing protein [Christiangramia fulva]